jgi:hypothetical protein
MKVLNQREITEWLQERGHVEDPHQNVDWVNDLAEKYFHVQRYAPSAYSTVESLTDQLISSIVPDGELLLQIVEWDSWCDPRAYVIKNLLPTFDEAIPYRQMGGFLFEMSERAKAIALFSLTSSFGWKSYLYGEFDQVAWYNWEGEIFDFWTSSHAKIQEAESLFNHFKLSPV